MHSTATTPLKSTKKPLSAGAERAPSNARQPKPIIDFATSAAIAADPIFAAIEAHKAATVALDTEIKLHSRLERELPRERRRSSVTAHGEEIVETDDPHWVESERAVWRTYEAQDDAACELVSVQATTMAGVIALLQYAADADTDGMGWPVDLQSDDGKLTRSWHYFLAESVAAAMTKMELRVN